MTDKNHLAGKPVVFRMAGSAAHAGIVKFVEEDGFWIESEAMVGSLLQDQMWAPMVKQLQNPVIFIPTANLQYLIASLE